jgi:hypothetical protein
VGTKNRRKAMTDETRKDQEKKEELTEKDLDQASGGGPHMPAADRPEEVHRYQGNARK